MKTALPLAPMTMTQWEALSLDEKRDVWPRLSHEERDSIIRADRRVLEDMARPSAPPAHQPTPAQTLRAYERPAVCGVLYCLAVLSGGAGIVFLLRGEIIEAAVSFGTAFSLLAWGQMLDHIARAAHYTQQTAEIMARVHPAPAAPGYNPDRYFPTAESIVRHEDDIRKARAAMEEAKSLYRR